MSGFLAKLVLAVVAVYLILGYMPATSASNLDAEGGEKSSWHIDCKDGLRKVIGRKQGYWGCQNSIVRKKIVPIRSLRILARTAPPSPVKNKATSQKIIPAPPPYVV